MESGQQQNVGVVSLLPEPVNDGEAFERRQLDIQDKDVVFSRSTRQRPPSPWAGHIRSISPEPARCVIGAGELGTLGTTFLEK